MKKILGSMILLLALHVNLLAGVEASVDKQTIYAGQSVSYTIKIEGSNPIFPNIQEIAGYRVEGTSSSRSINIINGNTKSITAKTYMFTPTRSLNIPPYKVKIDGKVYATNEIEIRIVKATATKSGDEFSIDMRADKKDIYVGEPIKIDVNLRYKVNAKADKIALSPLKIDDFWIKKTDKPIQSNKGDTIIQTYRYIVFPQKEGDFTVPPIELNIGKIKSNSGGNFFNDPFFDNINRSIQWRKFLSNSLNIHVKPLPNNLEVYGDFSILASVDKTKIKANKPVNLTLKIKGLGNIDDIKKFTLDIDNVVVYSDEPTIKAGLANGAYGGTFTQKIALIADRNFTIEPLIFKYFDKNTNKVVTKKTNPIFIKVEGGNIINKSTIQTLEQKNTTPKTTTTEVMVENKDKELLYLLVGFLLGILISLGYVRFSNRKKVKKEISIIQKIKKAKTDRELFDVLLPYGENDTFVKEKLEILEANIYGKAKSKIDKKEIIEYCLMELE